MGIWDCWTSCQKVCHLHRGCLAGVMDQRPAWNTLLGCLRNAQNLLDWLQPDWTFIAMSMPSVYNMLSNVILNVTSPWHLQPTFPPIFSAATGRGPWILMTWMMQKRPWARSWWICVSRSELLLDWEHGPQLMARCGTPIDLGWFPDPNGPVWAILGWVETCAVFAMFHSKNSMLRYDQDWLNTTQQGFFRWVETWNMLKPFESVKSRAICVDFRWF